MTRGTRLAMPAGLAWLLLATWPARARADTTRPEPEVVVRGTAAEGAPRDSTAASTVVAGDELRAAGASAADVLGRVPGVEISRTGASSDLATAAIRGATSAETPIYLAGVRLNDDVTGTADLSTLPLFLMDRVEVYRGNAPFDADRLGIGGAVFFEPRFPRRSELGAGASLGSFGERSIFGTGEAAGERASALVALRREGAAEDYPYQDDAGRTLGRKNADYVATDAWSVARYDLAPSARITTVLHAYDREQGSPGLGAAPNDRARTRTRRLLGAATLRLPCGRKRTGDESCSFELVTSALAGKSVLTDPLAILDTASLVATGSDRIEETARLATEPSDALTLGGSVSVSYDRIAVERPATTPTAASRATARPAVSATLHASRVTDVTSLVGLECHSTTSSGRSSGACDAPEPGGRLGVVLRLTQALDVRTNLGHYARVPTLGELYGVSAVVRGNPGLAAETGNTVDLGVHVRARHAQGRSDFDVFGFARTASDLVSYRQNVLGVVVPYNVGRARVLGAEMAGSSELFRVLGNTLSLTLLDARDTTPGRTLANDILPFRSRLVWSDYSELHTTGGLPSLALDRAGLGFRVTHRSSRYADEGGLIVIPSQLTMDLEASLSFLRRTVAARLALRNLLGSRELDTVGMPLPGRSVHGTVEAFFR